MNIDRLSKHVLIISWAISLYAKSFKVKDSQSICAVLYANSIIIHKLYHVSRKQSTEYLCSLICQ